MSGARPSADPDLTALDSHFAFGENWQSFAAGVSEDAVAEAVLCLERLFPQGGLVGKRFLDIGCGSGLSMLAAARLGAASVTGVDIDPHSVAAAQGLLGRFLPQGGWTVRQASIFDVTLPDLCSDNGGFDVVHSWGVLHHTGAMTVAIGKAAALVGSQGCLALALYRKTPLCGFWTWAKRLYAHGGPGLQAMIRLLYKTAYMVALVATGRAPWCYLRDYKKARGMDWAHDVHDWLGGYPYESVLPSEVAQLLKPLGFAIERQFDHPAAAAGLFGSHCDEFVARRSA